MTNGQTRWLRAVGVAAFTALGLPTAATADDSPTITACVSRDGKIRLLSEADLHARRKRAAGRCGRGERLVTWNITGPPGPIGPRGPEGAIGPQGQRGFDGPPGPGFAGTQYYAVGAGDLRPIGPGFFALSLVAPPGGTFSTAAVPLLAGVHLPQHARIVAVRAHVFDNSASNLAIDLVQQPLSGEAAVFLSAITTNGAAAAPYAIDEALAIPHDVDNAGAHYFVRVSPNPGWTATSLQVLGVTIVYTLETTPGP